MQIKETNVWKDFEFIWLIIKERLDPWSIFKNSKVFALYNKGELVSFCTVKKWKTSVELGTVVTKKAYRGKGYAEKVIKYFLKEYPHSYVTCLANLENFYRKFGYKKVERAPYPIYHRIKFFNLFGKKYIIMKR